MKSIAAAWPFVLLCAIAATLWLLLERFPQITFDLRSSALAALLAAILSAVPGRRRTHVPLTAAAGGALVLLAPGVGTLLHAQDVSPGGLTVALALTPVVVAVAAPALTHRDFSPTRLWPGILAAAALLIATPVPSLGNVRNDAAMILAPLLLGIGCVLYRRGGPQAPGFGVASADFSIATASFAMAAGVLTLAAFLQHATGPLAYPAIGLETVIFLLTLLSLNRLNARQYSSRFALVPLLLLLEGPIFLTVALINTRTVLSALCLLVATVALLLPVVEENRSEDSLRLETLQR